MPSPDLVGLSDTGTGSDYRRSTARRSGKNGPHECASLGGATLASQAAYRVLGCFYFLQCDRSHSSLTGRTNKEPQKRERCHHTPIRRPTAQLRNTTHKR